MKIRGIYLRKKKIGPSPVMNTKSPKDEDNGIIYSHILMCAYINPNSGWWVNIILFGKSFSGWISFQSTPFFTSMR